MNIIFDCRIYETSLHRGIGRYVYSLIDHILKNFPELNISILKVNENEIPQFNYRNNHINYYFYNKLDTYNFEEKFDFYFVDDVLVSSIKIKSVNTFFNDLFPKKILKFSKKVVAIIYDLIPITLSNYYLVSDEFINNYLIHLETVYILDHMFAISECTKNDFIKYLNINENKITNIYGGFDTKFNNLNIDSYNYNKRNNSIVFISVYEDPRKNVFRLIRGFSKAYHSGKIPKDSKLYLCGKVSEHFYKVVEKEILNNNLTEDNIVITGYISDDKLIDLILNSKANILPSIYEGLGLSILESYACNTPSFASNTSSTKELVLEECNFDPYDEDDIANSIIKSLTDEELCNRALVFGKKLLEKKCNWDIASKKVISKLYELMKYIDIDNALFTNDIYYYNFYKYSHIFTTLNTVYDIRNLNNSIAVKKNNNTIIPIEYYNKFQDKYNYKNKIFVFNDTEFNINIINIIQLEDNYQNYYLLFSNNIIFPTIFNYFNNSISYLKNNINKYYPNSYPLIEKLSNEDSIFNILQEKNIYGFSILLDIMKIYNIIICDNSIKEIILKDLELGIINHDLNMININK
ncbi:glycosyltransferase family 4 protein [Brachyspira pilosicoli]|uniref:glycosyltransferase family 4 protein n=1 Tax=Brachyspira pilosicoli TaxID=52584 RepID=UPI0012F50A2C|nr:glycosyltransferase family 1 protein [Brachyspira pilosicoli]